MRNKILFFLVIVLLAFSCKTVKEVDKTKTDIKTDSTSTVEIFETVDTTVTKPADTTSLNNLPITLITDTTDTTPVVFDNEHTTVIIKKHKGKKTFDLVVINKEEKISVKFTRKIRKTTRVKKAIHTNDKHVKKVTTGGGSAGWIVGLTGVSLLLLALIIYYLYRRWKKIKDAVL